VATLRALVVSICTAAAICPLTRAISQDLPSAHSQPEFPLIVRVDDRALDGLRDKDIRHRGKVDQVVLGTRAVGTSHTTGATEVKINADQDDASFTIRFRGRTETATVGRNGPAIIHSRTFTDFECARYIQFQPRTGLVAGKITTDARTSLVYDGFDADRRMGKRLITRVAKQRATEQREAARRLAEQDNEAKVRQAFEERLDSQLAQINSRLNIARYVNALFGAGSRPRLAARSCEDCILIAMGSERSPAKLTTALPERKNSAPIEIWIHQSMLGSRVAAVAGVLDKIEEGVLPGAAEQQIFQLLNPPRGPQRQVDVAVEKDWVVIGLPSESPSPGAVLLTLADFATPRPAIQEIPAEGVAAAVEIAIPVEAGR